jgi:U3 small nucleolar RNA-associated protein MPP10
LKSDVDDFDYGDPDGGTEDDEGDDDDDGNENVSEDDTGDDASVSGRREEKRMIDRPSKLEEKMRRIKEETAKIEAELVGKKRWDMIGEVKGADRPENSLLEAVADVDRLSKPAPIITKEYTSTVEELIKARIKEEKFDDVQPLVIAPKAVRSSFDLSQERNSQGLGQLYEDEFLQKTGSVSGKPTEKEAALITEIDDLFEKVHISLWSYSASDFDSLLIVSQVSRQLDGLSHFYFTPKPIIREPTLRSVENVPSLSLEEAAPSILNLASSAGTCDIIYCMPTS